MSGADLTPRPPTASETETVQLVLPSHSNSRGTVFGGIVMQWIDAVAAMSARRHCRRVVVTAAIDALQFWAPINIGDHAVLRARVNRTWSSSMEVEVTVDAEHPLSGELRRSAEAYLTFIGLDDHGRPAPVAPIAPVTDEERARFDGAGDRRQARLAARADRSREHGPS